MDIQIYRTGAPIAKFNCAADGIATFTRSLMNEHKIVCQWISYDALGLMINDYIEYNGVKFKINTPPSETKLADYAYQYQVTFEAPIYDLYNKIYSHNDGVWVTDWNLGGSPEDFIDILIANMNLIDSGWTKGVIDTADDQLISFSRVQCREALNTIADTFGLEWYLNNKEIHLVKKVGTDSILEFEYGQDKGLYELSRQAIDSKNLVTRLQVYGSDRNNDGKPLTIPAIDTNVDKYGIREYPIVFDEVYPHRESAIGTVAADGLSFQDSTMDFDLNAYLTTDTAQISFLTGDLVGYNLEITGYDNATKTFTLKKFTDTDGTILPSADDKPRPGDKYTILGITMPQTYIDAAIAELTTKGNEYAAENGIPRVQYGCKVDMLWAMENNILVNIGDRVTVKDSDMGINNQIRVSSISFPLYQPFNMTFVIADSVGYTVTERVIAKTIDNTKAIKQVDRSRILDYRRGAANQDALRDSIFDPSGQYFDPANIKPQSIETLMLSVGAKSQNFQLSGAYIKLANNNLSATATATKLIHNTMQIEGLGYVWDIASNNSLPLPTTTAIYYLYAKCSATQLTGAWVADTAQHEVDSEAGYFWFLVGTIYPVVDGYRGMSLTYGYASINGRTILAGRIQSLDGQTYFDLDTNEIHGKITFTSGSSGYNNLTDKPDLTPFEDTTDYVNNTLPDVISGLQNQIDGQIESWFYPGAPTLLNPPVTYDGTDPDTGWTTDAIKDKHLGDLYYNQTDGKGYRFSKTGSVYSWTLLADTDIALALSKADAAQDTADHKRRVFVVQPAPPYEIGDLWAQGTAGDLMRCQIARASGAYQAGDWIKASKYTDDTVANAAADAASAAQDAADSAQSDADSANNALADISNDNKLTALEKQETLKEWQIIQSEKTTIDAQAAKYSISASAYATAYDNLNTYITPLLASLTTTSDITGSLFRDTFKAYYVQRTAVLRAISDNAKDLADAAQSTANDKNKTFVASTAPTASAIGDLWIDTSAGNTLKRWSGSAWTPYQDAGISAANTLAGTKNKTYTGSATPTGMTAGDLWLDAGHGNVLKRYSGSAWVTLQDADIATAITNAQNAQSTADKAKAKTDFISDTTVDGNYIATGTLEVGDASGGNAGISGVTDGTAKWRFWAGADFATRANAPFRVQDDGQVWMTAVHINTRDPNNNMRGAVIDSTGQEISLYSGNLKNNDSATNPPNGTPDTSTPDISINSSSRSIEVAGDWYDGNRDATRIGFRGIVSNASSYPWGTGNSTASITGFLRRRSNSIGDISAAIVGIDQSTSGSGASFGGYFNSLFGGSEHVGVASVSSGTPYTIPDYISVVAVYSTSNFVVILPANAKPGRRIRVIQMYAFGYSNVVTVSTVAGAPSISNKSGSTVGSIPVKAVFGFQNSSSAVHSDSVELVFDGTYWSYQRSWEFYGE